MTDDVDAIHARWASRLKLHRDTSRDDYPDEWYFEQCGGCRHYLPVDGPLGEDWGVCSNGRSPCDATLRFEHDGCEAFEPDETGRAPFA